MFGRLFLALCYPLITLYLTLKLFEKYLIDSLYPFCYPLIKLHLTLKLFEMSDRLSLALWVI